MKTLKNLIYLLLGMGLLFTASCTKGNDHDDPENSENTEGTEDTEDTEETDRTKMTHLEGFELDFPEATNVQWSKDDLGYNQVSFDLKVASAKSKAADSYNAEAWYDDIYINFLTQEYIPVSEVPSEYITVVREVEEKPALECIEAIKGTCKENVFYKLLFLGDGMTYIYTICDGKVADYDEGRVGDKLPKTELPDLYAMRYVELNYDNYCLTSTAYTEEGSSDDNDNENGYCVPLYFYDKNYPLSEIVFVDGKIDLVREVHFLLDLDVELEALPDNVPEDIKDAVYDYVSTEYSSVKDDIVYVFMLKWCDSMGAAEYYYLNFKYNLSSDVEYIGIKIMSDGSIINLQE